MTTISTGSTGTVSTIGSTTLITSSASGLDTSSLIATAMATYTASADTIDAEVTANTTKITAYTDLQTLVNAVSSSIDDLASSTNVASGTISLWGTTAATVTSSDSSVTASSVVTATSTTAAVDGSYSLGVTQLALAQKVASTPPATDDVALNETGTFTIGASDGTAVSIDVTSTMTLSDIANAISAESSTTGVNATLIQSTTGEYSLVLSTADAGQTITTDSTSGDDVLTTIGLTSSTNGSFADTIQASQDAVITLDGTSITRSSNTIDDVIPGVTLDLTGTTGSTAPLTLTIAQDDSGVTTAVNNFITAYNDLHDYIETQEAVTASGTPASTAYLFGDSTMQSLNNQLNALINSTSSTSTGSSGITFLSQLGITMDSSNELELSDPAALSTAIASNSTALQSFFQSSYTTSNSHLLLMSNTSSVSQSFTLDIQAGSTGITGATVNGVSGLFTVNGDELVGAQGTIYAGLTFAITATADTSVNVDIQQGFADSVVALANQFGDTTSGSLESEITGLTSTDTTLSARSALIHSQATAYETTLIDKYATMETAVSSAQLMQEEIDAVLNASSSSS
ncbi:MAG: flagellar filament capping protein FliD [Caulobacteraceae bacterium]